MGQSKTGLDLRQADDAVEEAEARLNHYSRKMCMRLAYVHQGHWGIQAVYDIIWYETRKVELNKDTLLKFT